MIKRNRDQVPLLDLQACRLHIVQDIGHKGVVSQGTPFGLPVVPEVYIRMVMSSSPPFEDISSEGAEEMRSS